MKDRVRKINGMLEVFTELAEGQGYAEIHVWDSGAGGGDSWSIQVNLERDGLTFGREEVSKDELRKIIYDLLDSRKLNR